MNRYLKYFTKEYWNSFFSRKNKSPSFFSKVSRVALAASRGFNYDDCTTKASALTFYSLLSIVPVLAVAYGIAKGFGFEKHLELELQEKFLEQPEVANKLFEFAHKLLASTQGGVIGGVGVVALLWTVLKLLGNIESSFNAIWKVKQARSFSRKFSDYLALMIFCPLFFAASSSISVFVMTNIADVTQSAKVLHMFSPLVTFAFHLFPIVFSWLLFAGLYYIMPNVQVPLRYALIAGVIAGTAYQILQWTYFHFQFTLSSYGAIYGSFAALPLFLLWLNFSWLIALAGAEIAYHAEMDHSHAKLYVAERQCSVDGRILGLLVMHSCIKAFATGGTPPTEYVISQQLGVPVIEVRKILQSLIEAGLLVEVKWKDGISGYFQPARSINSISLQSVCFALDSARQVKYAVIHWPEVDLYEQALNEVDQEVEGAQKKFQWTV